MNRPYMISFFSYQLLQLQEELLSSSAEKDRLHSERTEKQQEKLAELKTAEANITALTEERDRLLETLKGVRDEREQLKRDQLEKSEMVTETSCTPPAPVLQNVFQIYSRTFLCCFTDGAVETGAAVSLCRERSPDGRERFCMQPVQLVHQHDMSE